MEIVVTVCFAFVGLLFAAIGAFILAGAVRRMRAAAASRAWSRTDGRVRSSRVIIDPDQADDDGAIPPSRIEYVPEVLYDYNVAGTPYQGFRVSLPGEGTYGPDWAEQAAERYPAGATVTVHYDPRDPARSVLEPGGAKGSWSQIAVGAGFILFGITFTFVTIYGLDRMMTDIAANKMGTARGLALAGIVAGALATLYGLWLAKKWLESRRWPMAEGRVIESRVLEEGMGRGRAYRAEVAYEYLVGGTKHLANRVTLADYATNNRERAERIAARYPKGSTVSVRYDPDQPSRAALETRTGCGVWLLLAIGVGFVIFSAFFLTLMEWIG